MATADEMATGTGGRRLGREDDGHPVSADEFASAFYNEPWIYERVDGRLVVFAPNDGDQVETIEPWRDQLVACKLRRPDMIRQIVSQPWVRVDGDNDRIGDIGVYLAGEGDHWKIPHRVPELLFEFVGRPAINRHHVWADRRMRYERIGVREYVGVDRFDQAVTISTLGANGYVERVLGHGEAYESPLLPGLVISLAEVWLS